MTCTVVVLGVFREGYDAVFPEYSRRVRQLLTSCGGAVIRRQRVLRALEGHSNPDMIMLVDFADAKAASDAFSSNAYQQIIPLRRRVFRNFRMYLAEGTEIV